MSEREPTFYSIECSLIYRTQFWSIIYYIISTYFQYNNIEPYSPDKCSVCVFYYSWTLHACMCYIVFEWIRCVPKAILPREKREQENTFSWLLIQSVGSDRSNSIPYLQGRYVSSRVNLNGNLISMVERLVVSTCFHKHKKKHVFLSHLESHAWTPFRFRCS